VRDAARFWLGFSDYVSPRKANAPMRFAGGLPAGDSGGLSSPALAVAV